MYVQKKKTAIVSIAIRVTREVDPTFEYSKEQRYYRCNID